MTEYTKFTDRDDFQRQSIAENIIKLIDRGDFTPMLLDGPWGCGKTEFSHKLISLIEETKKDWQVAYIDAFRADHSDEPLITLIAAIAKLLPEKGGKRKYLLKQAVPAIKFGLKTTAKAAVAHMTRESFDDVAEEYHSAIDKALNKSIDATVESLLQEHVEADKNLETLQGSLRVIAEEKPLILIVDELDRCRPDFAVEILELIKHVFDVPNVHFLLVTNTQQLKAAINHRYGLGVDALRYLDKFLKYKVQLSPFLNRAQKQPIPAVMMMYNQLMRKTPDLKDCEANHSGDIRFKFLQTFFETHSFSLRETEALVRNMQVYNTISNSALEFSRGNSPESFFEFVGILLCTFNPSLAHAIAENRASNLEFFNFFKMNERRSRDVLYYLLLFISYKLPGDENALPERTLKDICERLRDNGFHIASPTNLDLGALKRAINFTSLRSSL